jgi:competence protein ComEA
MDTQATTPRSSQWALAVFAAALLGLLVYRGYGHHAGARPTDHHPAHRIDLNTADRAELAQLDGVGPVLADKIVVHRAEYGPFESVDALDDVHGIGPRKLDQVRPHVTVNKPEPPLERLERKPASAPTPSGKVRPGDPPIDVNAATEAELMRLPGVGPVTARKIIEFRARERFGTADDLLKVKGIGPKTLDGLRPYVVCK